MKYPLFKVIRSSMNGVVQVITEDHQQALARANAVYAEKGIRPISNEETVVIKHDGTVDFIPALPVDHIEGK